MVDDLAGTIAQRATELRWVVAKGARAQKKRALTALLEALQAAGASRRRSAVPAAERTVQSWFRQVRALTSADTRGTGFLSRIPLHRFRWCFVYSRLGRPIHLLRDMW